MAGDGSLGFDCLGFWRVRLSLGVVASCCCFTAALDKDVTLRSKSVRLDQRRVGQNKYIP